MAIPVESAPAELPEASPLWPLVRLLAEIAARVEGEQAAARDGGSSDTESIDAAA